MIGAEHVPHVSRNAYGTPLVDSLFREAHRVAHGHGLLAYVNADVVLLDDFRAALERLPASRFLVAGRRRNLDLGRELMFEDEWQAELRRRARRAPLAPPWGSDYFVFPADGTFARVPPFAVGRAGWDNWLIAKARRERIPVVDATRAITAVHQAHGYDHIPGYTGSHWGGPESQANAALARATCGADDGVVFHLWDATHVLTARGPRRTVRPVAIWRRWRTRRLLAA